VHAVRTILSILLIFLLVHPDQAALASIPAEPNPSFFDHTVEALVAASELIVEARVVSHVKAAQWHLVVTPTQVRKSPAGYTAPPTLDLTFAYASPVPDVWPATDDPILLFARALPSTTPVQWEVNDFMPLAPAGRAASYRSEAIVDLSLEPLATQASVLQHIQEELGRTPPTSAVESFRLFSIEPYVHLEPHVLPADPRIATAARAWIRSTAANARFLAVQVMVAHPEPEDTPALRSCLTDSNVVTYPTDMSPWAEYFIRIAAAQALIKRGEPVPAVDFWAPEPAYRPVALGRAALVLLVPVILYLFVARRRARTAPARGVRKPVLNFVTFLCLSLACLFAAAYLRCRRTADDFVWAKGGWMVDVSSVRPNIIIECLHRWPGETAPVHFAITPDLAHPDAPDNRLAFRNSRGPAVSSLASWFGTMNQRIGADFAYEPHSYRFPRVPSTPGPRGVICVIGYGYAIALCLAFPLLRLAGAGLAAIRTRRRVRRFHARHLCPVCSYDLRAHALGAPCPECGTSSPARPMDRSP
jgi:hypothetical protein